MAKGDRPLRKAATAGISMIDRKVEEVGTMARKKSSETSAAERYSHVARWCNQYGWIEVG